MPTKLISYEYADPKNHVVQRDDEGNPLYIDFGAKVKLLKTYKNPINLAIDPAVLVTSDDAGATNLDKINDRALGDYAKLAVTDGSARIEIDLGKEVLLSHIIVKRRPGAKYAFSAFFISPDGVEVDPFYNTVSDTTIADTIALNLGLPKMLGKDLVTEEPAYRMFDNVEGKLAQYIYLFSGESNGEVEWAEVEVYGYSFPKSEKPYIETPLKEPITQLNTITMTAEDLANGNSIKLAWKINGLYWYWDTTEWQSLTQNEWLRAVQDGTAFYSYSNTEEDVNTNLATLLPSPALFISEISIVPLFSSAGDTSPVLTSIEVDYSFDIATLDRPTERLVYEDFGESYANMEVKICLLVKNSPAQGIFYYRNTGGMFVADTLTFYTNNKGVLNAVLPCTDQFDENDVFWRITPKNMGSMVVLLPSPEGTEKNAIALSALMRKGGRYGTTG